MPQSIWGTLSAKKQRECHDLEPEIIDAMHAAKDLADQHAQECVQQEAEDKVT